MTEALHLLQNLVDLWHYIFPLNQDGSVGTVPQSHVEHSTALQTTKICQVDIAKSGKIIQIFQ